MAVAMCIVRLHPAPGEEEKVKEQKEKKTSDKY
jgi:hypothetical protein